MVNKTTASNNVNEEMMIPSSLMVGLKINGGLQIKEIQFYFLKTKKTRFVKHMFEILKRIFHTL